MMSFLKPVAVAFKAATVIFLFFYLPACFVYLVSPASWWFMGILSISFPYLWLLLFIIAISWWFINRRSSLILFALLIAGIPVIKNVLALGSVKSFQNAKASGSIRIMQWNCNGLQGYLPYSAEQHNERVKAVAFIRQYNPDIICIQDFSNTIKKGVRENKALLRDTLGYPFFTYAQHYTTTSPGFHEGIGIAIFSKYPIRDTGRLYYPHKKNPETIIWANFLIDGKPLRVATTHLQSMHLSRSKKDDLEPGLWEDSAVILHGSVLQKLSYFQPFHVTEGRYLRRFIDTCSGPLIFTADLNSVPSSFVYKTVKGKDLNDVFLEKSFGLGRTYHSIQPALRIDYIFHKNGILPLQASLFRTTFSDHDPIIMDFKLE